MLLAEIILDDIRRHVLATKLYDGGDRDIIFISISDASRSLNDPRIIIKQDVIQCIKVNYDAYVEAAFETTLINPSDPEILQKIRQWVPPFYKLYG